MLTILVQHVNYSGTTRKFCANYYFTMGVYDSLYSTVHPMKYVESDVMWYKLVAYILTGFLLTSDLSCRRMPALYASC